MFNLILYLKKERRYDKLALIRSKNAIQYSLPKRHHILYIQFYHYFNILLM